jgi:sulfite reductase alpha subunit-like flavoprotein
LRRGNHRGTARPLSECVGLPFAFGGAGPSAESADAGHHGTGECRIVHDAASSTLPLAIKLHILVGTMTGTAELVAQELELAFGDENLAIEITLMDGLDHRVFERPGIFLICTSTYGQGEVPDNAKALYADLLSSRPDLSRVRYGVFALGDSTHVGTFCFGGKCFDEALGRLGATRLGAVFEHNASGGTLPEDVALEWFPEWIAEVHKLLDAAAAAPQNAALHPLKS